MKCWYFLNFFCVLLVCVKFSLHHKTIYTPNPTYIRHFYYIPSLCTYFCMNSTWAHRVGTNFSFPCFVFIFFVFINELFFCCCVVQGWKWVCVDFLLYFTIMYIVLLFFFFLELFFLSERTGKLFFFSSLCTHKNFSFYWFNILSSLCVVFSFLFQILLGLYSGGGIHPTIYKILKLWT